jgi:hypothetical protein
MGKTALRYADEIPDIARAGRKAEDLAGSATFFRVMDAGGYVGKMERHHLAPQEFKWFFKGKVDMNKNTVLLDRQVHKILHGKRLGPFKIQYLDYNDVWDEWIKGNRQAGEDAISKQIEIFKKVLDLP